MDLTLPLWLVALVVLLIGVLLMMIWSSRRTLAGNITGIRLETIEDLLPNLASLTGEPVIDGNSVEVIQDAAFFDALLEEVRKAESSIHYETYVWWKGDICHEFARAFAEKARAGVEVRLLLDAHGSLLMDDDVLEMLEDSGCAIGRYNRFRLRDIGKVNSRDHRKIAVIDGRTAFFMGHGMASEWCTKEDGGEGWRDTAVRLRGPVVRSAQAVFLRNWLNVVDEIAVEAKHFPELEPAGDSRVHIADSDPVGTYSEVEVLLKVAIASSREQVLIQNPYFVPHESVVDLLGAADERGVDVQIMLPRENDSRLVRHASHKFYGQLLRRGVRIWEYQPTFAHQKIVVVDGVWSHVGSTNFDHRSLQINREVSVGIYDPRVASELIAAFESDLEDCEEITLEGWQSRSSWKRLGDNLAFLVREQI